MKKHAKKARDKKAKKDALESLYSLLEGREKFLNNFKSRIIPLVPIYGAGHHSDLTPRLKILTPKQMFRRLLIALAQVKTCNAS